MTRETVLALGLLLTTATKFRAPGLPIGPGELLLVVWILGTLLQQRRGRAVPITPGLRRMMIFWGWFTVAESLGTLTALVIHDRHDTGLFLHDVLAYPLVGTMACLSVLGSDAEPRLRHVARSMLLWGSVLLAPQLAAGLHLFALPLFDPWFGDRFEGWSTNPNQLAFLCAVLVLCALQLADMATRSRDRWAIILGMIVPLWIGRLTKTDTFTFALLAAIPVFMLGKVRLWLAWQGARPSLRTAFAAILVLTLPAALLSAAPLVARSAHDTGFLTKNLMKNGGKEAKEEADLRLELWREAIDRGLSAGMLGLGPGPHLPIPPALVAARETEPTLDKGAGHPPVNGTPDFEAHNTLLDLFTQGGVIADVSLLWLTVRALLRTWTAQMAGLTALLVGLMLFAMTNLIVREPIFWFGIAFCLVAGEGGQRPHAGGRLGQPYQPRRAGAERCAG